MRTACLTLIFIVLTFKLQSQPEIQTLKHLPVADTSIFPVCFIDSIEHVLKTSKIYEYISNLRIRQNLSNTPFIITDTKYLYPTLVDSIPEGHGESAFDENGNIIYSSRYSWDRDIQNWDLSGKMEFNYDQSGRDTSLLIYQKHIPENRMILVYKWSAKYNQLGDKTFDKQYSYFIDSDSWVETSWEYEYNIEGHLLNANQYFMNNNMNGRFNTIMLEQKYDEKNNKISREMYSHDRDLNRIGEEKMEWDYDSSGRIKREVVYAWDTEGIQWLINRKSEYSHDSSDNIDTELIFIPDNSNTIWILDRKFDFTYDMLGNNISKLCFEYDSTSEHWIGSYRFDYSYDSNGREIASIQYGWDDILGIWIPIWNKQMNYGSNVFLASYFWNNKIDEWIGDWKRETLYNTYGDYYFDAYYEWDSISSDWYIKSGVSWDRNYDFEDNEIESIGYNWNQDKLSWIPGGKFEWIYDMKGDLILYMDYAWIQDKESWALYSKRFYNYRKGFVTALAENEPDNITLYPNPAGSFLKIDGIDNLAGIDVYSMSGYLYISERGSKRTVDLSILPDGIYIIALHRADKTKLTRKVVKR